MNAVLIIIAIRLAFARLDLVTAERFLCLSVGSMPASLWVILTQNKLPWSVQSVLARYVGTVVGEIAHKSNNLSLGIVLLCHFFTR